MKQLKPESLESGAGNATYNKDEESNLTHLMGRALLAIKQVIEKELGVNLLTARILFALAKQDGATQNYLTGCLGVDPSMITRTVKEMEGELGWVRRERDPEDNRLMRVYLTEIGRQHAQVLPQQAKEIEGRLTGNLNQTDLAHFRQYLHILEETARHEYQNIRLDGPQNN
ncbi:MAG TPA: MarR family winged helix-turn-helix transcriptional regulator [Chloroflexia bacterium]|nr:MarR family winged helix-turn-helix transcriptional regulator [Chloroflexia bacterium]